MIKELIFEAYKILTKNCDSDCENCKYLKENICDKIVKLYFKYYIK